MTVCWLVGGEGETARHTHTLSGPMANLKIPPLPLVPQLCLSFKYKQGDEWRQTFSFIGIDLTLGYL